MSHQTVAEELEKAQAKIALLKESRAAAMEQEQLSRVECNRLRQELNALRASLLSKRPAWVAWDLWLGTEQGRQFAHEHKDADMITACVAFCRGYSFRDKMRSLQ